MRSSLRSRHFGQVLSSAIYFLTLYIFASGADLHAATIRVPADQPTIQAGIDAAILGDTVLVADGTYTGDGNRDIDFGGKGIVLKSENGPDIGQVYVYSGKDGAPLHVFNCEKAGDGFGKVVSGTADVNNGGVNELIVGANLNDDGLSFTGRAYVYLLDDSDADGVLSNCDNCPSTYNPGQEDSDWNGTGDICEAFLCGDANRDSLVTMDDVAFLRAYYFNCDPAPFFVPRGDLNCDKAVDFADIIHLIQYIHGTGAKPCCAP